MKISHKRLVEMIDQHEIWINTNGAAGKRFEFHGDLSYADLSDAYLRDARLDSADLTGANLRGTNLNSAQLRKATLVNVDLTNADLQYAKIIGANLHGSKLIGSNWRMAYADSTDFTNVTMFDPETRIGTCFRGACLIGSNLTNTDMTNCDLLNCRMHGANLTNVKGLRSQKEYMDKTFEKTEDGYIVYKCFGLYYNPKPDWDIAPGSIIEDPFCNMDRCDGCGKGINVATLKWFLSDMQYLKKMPDIWKCLIRYEWLDGVCAPYATDGKIRCNKLQLIEIL